MLSAPVVLWAGWPFFSRGTQSIINRSPNIWPLIGLGVAAAFGYSVIATFAPELFPATFMQDGRVGVSLMLLGPDPGVAGVLPDVCSH